MEIVSVDYSFNDVDGKIQKGKSKKQLKMVIE